MISEKDLWDFAVDKAIEIWENRAKGIADGRGCPLCSMAELLITKENTDCCSFCLLIDCYSTPYGERSSRYGDREQSAIEMVNMLRAWKEGDIDLFNKYLHYWDKTTQERLW